MDDNKLEKIAEKIAYEIDSILAKLITKHELDALLISSIMLARLTRMNVEIDGGENFRSLMRDAMGKTLEQNNIH